MEHSNAPVVESKDIDDNTVVDLDAQGSICAIAFEHASERAGAPDFSYQQVAKEIVGGYWFIVARSLEEAANIASESPCLSCGLYYEIRPIDLSRATAHDVTCKTPGDSRVVSRGSR